MKLVDRTEFLQLPAGTLFSRYCPGRASYPSTGAKPQDPIEDLCLKGPTRGNAFHYVFLNTALSERADNDLDNNTRALMLEVIGAMLLMDIESTPLVDDSQDGVYPDDDVEREPDPERVIFLAWEAKDMMQLIAQLVPAIRTLAGDAATDEALRSLLPTSAE